MVKKLFKLVFSRVVIVGLLLLVQVVWLFLFFLELVEYSASINILLNLISLIAVLYIINCPDNPAFKMAWAIAILVFPVLGGLMYLTLGSKRPTKRLRRILEQSDRQLRPLLVQEQTIVEEIKQEDAVAAGQMHYIRKCAGYPVYEGTTATYFKSGEENFPILLQELKKAKHFIFMEYFIVEEGEMFDAILEVLKEKVAEGVDVRFIYDDFGSVTVLPYKYYERMERSGIQCEAFNKFIPIFSLVMNHRDHRKITVIDGHTGFTGGINLADEYINRKERFGYWKDTGIMLKGEAVWNLTAMFLTVWNAVRPTDKDFREFMPRRYYEKDFPSDGYVQPYGDSPLDNETVGENVYLNMIHASQQYIYMCTPYLIIDNEMMTALCLAAKRGVDVRIVTPNVPDKKIVFWLTQSYYPQLLKSGVKIYQFTPGFIHAKCFVCDDKYATVGTINMDYRSLYLHFECGVFLYRSTAIMKIKEDALETIAKSCLVTEKMIQKRLPIRLAQALLRVLAPLF